MSQLKTGKGWGACEGSEAAPRRTDQAGRAASLYGHVALGSSPQRDGPSRVGSPQSVIAPLHL